MVYFVVFLETRRLLRSGEGRGGGSPRQPGGERTGGRAARSRRAAISSRACCRGCREINWYQMRNPRDAGKTFRGIVVYTSLEEPKKGSFRNPATEIWGAVFAAKRHRLEQQPRKGAGRVQQVGISWKLSEEARCLQLSLVAGLRNCPDTRWKSDGILEAEVWGKIPSGKMDTRCATV
ncbi:uncharacterized protein LOC123331458 isoform X3 [Bubalus bubalis]|uniref:uncharacterized protein LOC123331458 isoform X3 n=1 Tax=Bubalus bubalis TaxID=89462 RepID=UPI001D12C1F4|nr:uncharacterized protein LOC123331458 isoform X3 [Bubalus bubalis]